MLGVEYIKKSRELQKRLCCEKNCIFVLGCMYWVAFYMLFWFVANAISLGCAGDISCFIENIMNKQNWYVCISRFPSFLYNYLFFFGEEYGWRSFLQPKMQKRFGQWKGIIFLGFLWGIWHLPLCLFYYSSPEKCLYTVCSKILWCIVLAIVFAYIYTTENKLITLIVIHFMHNLLATAFNFEANNAQDEGFFSMILSFIIQMVLCCSTIALVNHKRGAKNEKNNHNFREP